VEIYDEEGAGNEADGDGPRTGARNPAFGTGYALDAQIKLVIHHPVVWEAEDPSFSVADRLNVFGVSARSLATTAVRFLTRASSIDPMGDGTS
jgi:hypothetical protein